MLVNGKVLHQTPVITVDKVRYGFVDSLTDHLGNSVIAILVRNSSLLLPEHYVIPMCKVKVIIPQEGIYLSINHSDIENYALFEAGTIYSDNRFIDLYDNRVDDISVASEINAYLKLNDYYSLKNLFNFQVSCLDGKIGKVSDYYFHQMSSEVLYFAVELRHGFAKKWSFISKECVDTINWMKELCIVNLMCEDISTGALYRPNTPINENLEEVIYHQIEKNINSRPSSFYREI